MDAELLHPPSGASASKRKRCPWPHRPMSPIERLQAQADAEEEEDLDNFRQHKRYITEVMANGLSCALSLSSPAGTAPAWSHGAAIDTCAAAAMEADAGLAVWGISGWEQQAQQQAVAQQQPQQQQQVLGVLGSFPAALQWPPRRQQPPAVPVMASQAMDATSPTCGGTDGMQQPLMLSSSSVDGLIADQAAAGKPCGAATSLQDERTGAAAAPAPNSAQQDASKVDLRKVTLLRSLLHRTEEHLRQQGGGTPGLDAAAEEAGPLGCMGSGSGQASEQQQQPFRHLAATKSVASCWQQLAEQPSLWMMPAGAGAPPSQPYAQFAMARCSTPMSSEGSMGAGGGGAASPQSPASCEMATSAGERRQAKGRQYHEQDDSGDEGVDPKAPAVGRSASSSMQCTAAARDVQPHRQLSSWLLPFRQLSVHRQPQPQQFDPHQQQQKHQQQTQEGPTSPEQISLERIERLRAKALLAAASHPDLEEGSCSPKPGRRASMDELATPTHGDAARQQGHNCGEGWQIPAWRGGAARADSAARRHSSHI